MKYLRIKRIISLCMMTACLLSSCTTVKKIVYSTHAYAYELQFGTIKQESENQVKEKPDTLIVIYAETSNANIEWGQVIYNQHIFDVTAQLISTDSYGVGYLPGTDQEQRISIKKHHFLYQLQLNWSSKKTGPEPFNSKQLRIHLKHKKRNFTVYANEPVFLIQPPPS